MIIVKMCQDQFCNVLRSNAMQGKLRGERLLWRARMGSEPMHLNSALRVAHAAVHKDRSFWAAFYQESEDWHARSSFVGRETPEYVQDVWDLGLTKKQWKYFKQQGLLQSVT